MKYELEKRGYSPRLITIFILIILFLPSISYALKIVSLTPSITKQLISLDLKDSIIGCTSYCPLANDKNSKTSVVGSISDINIESIVKLNPDIVFANSLTNLKTINKLKTLKIRVEVFEYPKSIEEIFSSFQKLGEITGKTSEATQIITKSKDKLNSIKVKLQNKQKPKIFFVIGVNPLFTAPKNTYIDDIISIINGINIAHELNFGMVSKEFVLKSNPDVILVMNMGVLAQDVVNEFKRYPFLNAVKNNRFFIVDADRLGSPTLPDLIDLINEIGIMVHGADEKR